MSCNWSASTSNVLILDRSSGMRCFLFHAPQANWKKSWHGSADRFIATSNEAAVYESHIFNTNCKINFVFCRCRRRRHVIKFIRRQLQNVFFFCIIILKTNYCPIGNIPSEIYRYFTPIVCSSWIVFLTATTTSVSEERFK